MRIPPTHRILLCAALLSASTVAYTQPPPAPGTPARPAKPEEPAKPAEPGRLADPGQRPKSDAPAGPKPDFSGRWRMIKDKSDFGGFHMPDIVVRIVDDRSPTMNVHTVQTTGEKTTTSDVSYFTDGSTTKNVINGREAESRAYWDGPVLVIRTGMKDSKGEDEQIEDRWELSDDKETLTTNSHVETPNGAVDMKMVCSRDKKSGS
jgi:hypothetical protein